MSWLLNVVRFAQRFPFKCPKCGSAYGAFRERDGKMQVFCRDCGAAEVITREKIEQLIQPPKQLPK